MYIPPRYRVTDDAVIDAFLRAHGFATLVTGGGSGLHATHLPLELGHAMDGARVLQGHVSRANPQWRALDAGAEAMAVFLGPHAYISPTWYDHPNVPTWNYQAVHVYGMARVIAAEELLPPLRALSAHYEPPEQPGPRFDVDAMPPELRAAELKGITAFELRVTRVDAAFKLSQNRHAADVASIVSALEARGDDASVAIARAMMAQGQVV